MRLLWQAVRAATIETLAIVTIIWLLFGLPAYSYQWAVTSSSPGRTVWTWKPLIENGKVQPIVVAQPPLQRHRFTEIRLLHYGRLLRNAVNRHLRGVADQIAAQLPDGQHGTSPPALQVLRAI
jgi:hypothetical protein